MSNVTSIKPYLDKNKAKDEIQFFGFVLKDGSMYQIKDLFAINKVLFLIKIFKVRLEKIK